jgi:FSR family fosmidomycin resistance protein-like MFS transporter
MRYRSIGLVTLGHIATDLNQGAIPVLLPFFIAEHNLTYAVAATIVFTTTMVSTISQPIFGWLTDRLSKPWLIPVGVLLAGLGLSAVGIVPSYSAGLVVIGLSGLGVAAFHPEGARLANLLGGERKAFAMSIFAIGGQIGFAIGPLIASFALLTWGLKGTASFAIPAISVAALLAFALPGFSKRHASTESGPGVRTKSLGTDAWGAFMCLSATVLFRSVIFYGLNTFLPLFWINVLHQSKTAGASALTVLFASGVAGNLIGGRMADRFGYRVAVLVEFALLTVFLPFLVLTDSALWAMLLLVPIGLVLFASVSPMVVLGQSYLPNRVGLASGVTLGLALSFGGMVTPLLGWIADNHGLKAAMSVVVSLPIVCVLLALTLPAPKKAPAD